MQIAVLSDLHLGRRNRLDRFARKEADEIEPRFLQLLRQLEKNVDLIILNGDIFETLKGPHPGSKKRELMRTMSSYPEIAKRAVGNPRYRLLYGNHDIVAGRLLGAEEAFEIEDRGTKMLFFHGHQLDPLTRGKAYLSRAGVFASGWIERFGFDATPEDFRHVPGPAWRCAPSSFEEEAVRLAKQHGAEVVVTGHTHRAIRSEHGGCLYMNSGTCVAGRREMLLLDTQSARYEVLREPDFIDAMAS